jgi:transposase
MEVPAMGRSRYQSISPSGLIVEAIEVGADHVVVMARGAGTAGRCPDCGSSSGRVHSHYERRLLDLPSHGRAVHLRIAVRRFRCVSSLCRRRIFVERLNEGIAERSARRTARLDAIVHHLRLALGGRPAANLARRLMLPVSKDTLLRVVRRRAGEDRTPLRVVGIDDWAWKRGQRYGSIILDLERRRIVDLLPDREVGTVEAWLSRQPQIAVISRDRGGGYGRAAANAAPQAIQVADRWHLMENASAAFLDAVRRSMRLIRSALGATMIDPALLTSAERLQYDGYLRREEARVAIKALASNGASIKEIVRRTGRSRKLVRDVLRGGGGDIFRCCSNVLEPHLAWLDAEWSAGCRSGAELWRRLQAVGFRGSLRVVTEWATRRRRSERVGADTLRKIPPARLIGRLMLADRENLSKADATIVAAIERAIPTLAASRDLVDRFHQMLRTRSANALSAWITEAAASMLASFAKGIMTDLAAVTAALTEPWSNGQTEGQITKLKLVKRQMYGRGKFDLLRARLVVHA